MKTIGNILADHRKKMGLSQNGLALELEKHDIHVTYKAISKWEKDIAAPSIPTFLAVCKILGVKDIYEAYFGKNPFNPYNLISELNEAGREKLLDYIELLSESGKYKKQECTIIPFKRTIRLFDIPASAGTGEFLDGENYELIEVGEEVPSDADFGIRISGDSMEPRFINGQIVWVHQQETLSNGEIGIFYLDGNAYCKKFNDNENGISLISLNSNYEPITVSKNSMLKIFGKVIG